MKDLRIAIRSLKRNWIYSAIIIISLSLGLACLNLITTFLSYEFSTDNFHADRDRIYSIICDDAFIKGNKVYHVNNGVAEYMKNNFAQIEDMCTYGDFSFSKISASNNNLSNELKIIATSPNFFGFFSYPLIVGNPRLVLESEGNIVISDKFAQKYFGNDSPVGQTIEIEKSSKKYLFQISGIFKKINQNSQLDFDLVVKIKPESYRRGYLKLEHQSSAAEIQNLFSKFKTEIPITNGENQGQYYLQPLKETYFDTSRLLRVENSQSKTTLWIILSAGLLIMALALFNFLGIINHNLFDRAKSFSIFRLNGATKIHLTKTILTEVLFLLGTSFLLGMAIMIWMLPAFNNLIKTSINTNYAITLSNVSFLLSVLSFTFIIVSIFVVYKLNSITGLQALKGTKTNRHFQLPALNIFQLATTILLLVAAITIVKQIQFIDNRPIGLDKQVIDLSVPRNKGNKLGILKTKLLQSPTIKSASITSNSVFTSNNILINYEENGQKQSFSPTYYVADEDYFKTLDIKVTQGQDFSSDPLLNKFTCIINESMAKHLNRENIIGSELPGFGLKIIGIVQDYNYESLKTRVSPAFIEWDGVNRHLLNRASNILVKTSDNVGDKSMEYIKQAWKEILPDVPFEFETIEQQYLKLHADNYKTIQLVVLCCFVSILLSMMGLFAVVLQNSKLRVKEIGIRKVNGAKISEVMAILNKDFVKWVAVAFVIATPIAWYAMHKWLESFAYKTTLSWWIFALAGLLALGIALLTVSWQSWRAATRNPVEALRYE